ncbi:glycyl-tRNA synthetase subunit beta, partial [Brachyspira hampsonii 30599]
MKSHNIDANSVKNIDENESFDKPYIKEVNGKKIYIRKK